MLDADRLEAALDADRRAGRRIVFTNGCFDVLHVGHITSLKQARQLGDVLVVAVNDDDSSRRLKGPGRPINPAADRAGVLAELTSVDYVTVFGTDTAIPLLERLRPDVYAKGGDYMPAMLEETPIVEAYGGTVRILGYVSAHSTSGIIARTRACRRRRMTSRRSAGRLGRSPASPDPVIDVLMRTVGRMAELAVVLAGLAAQDDPPFRVTVSDQSDDHPAGRAGGAGHVPGARGAGPRPPRPAAPPPPRDRRAPRLPAQPGERGSVLFLDDDVWPEAGALSGCTRR